MWFFQYLQGKIVHDSSKLGLPPISSTSTLKELSEKPEGTRATHCASAVGCECCKHGLTCQCYLQQMDIKANMSPGQNYF